MLRVLGVSFFMYYFCSVYHRNWKIWLSDTGLDWIVDFLLGLTLDFITFEILKENMNKVGSFLDSVLKMCWKLLFLYNIYKYIYLNLKIITALSIHLLTVL